MKLSGEALVEGIGRQRRTEACSRQFLLPQPSAGEHTRKGVEIQREHFDVGGRLGEEEPLETSVCT